MNDIDFRERFHWPLARDLSATLEGEELYIQDPLLECIEELVSKRRAWTPVRGGTKRTEPESKLKKWLQEQTLGMNSLERLMGWDKKVTLNLDDFPRVPANEDKRIIATSKSILYLVDSTQDLVDSIGVAFSRKNRTAVGEMLNCNYPALLYLSNSVESGGRAFSGDPFTGEVAAFSAIFCYDVMGDKERNFIAYYPHQLYTQFFNNKGVKMDNKGVNVLQSAADLIITAKGILIDPKGWRIM